MWYNKEQLNDIIQDIRKEFVRARKIHPVFPDDPVHQMSIMMEEAGEAVRAVNNYVSEKGDIRDVEEELIQTAAMCIRVLLNLNKGNPNV